MEHELEIADPRLHQNQYEAWKPLLNLGVPACGANYDYAAIAERIDALEERIKYAQPGKPWRTTIFDELTRYGSQPDLDSKTTKLFEMCLADVRGAHEAPILLSHGKELAMLGKTSGFRRSIDRGILQLYLAGTTTRKGYAPLFKGHLHGIKDETGQVLQPHPISINPDWCHADVLVRLFGNKNASTKPPRDIEKTKTTEDKDTAITEDNESEDIEKIEPPKVVSEEQNYFFPLAHLSEDIREIWLVAKELQIPFKTRDIQIKRKQGYRHLNADQIRHRLEWLADRGFLERLGDDQFVAY